MNLFDLLTRKNGITDYSQNMPPLQAQPQMEAIQVDAQGAPITGIDIQPEKKMTIGDKFKGFSSNFGDKLTNALLGTSSQPTDSISTNGEMSATVSENPRVGGLLNDIASGYKENRNTPFSIQNLEPNRNKGIGYKIGEGLGSVARFGESPAGRALLVSGLVGLTGGNGLQALTFGASTGMQNQVNRMNDKIYRNDLINTQQQALMNSPEFNQLSETEQKQILDQLHTDSNYMGLSEEEAKGLNTEQYRAKLNEKQTNMKNKAIEDYLTGRQSQQLQDIADKVNSYRGYLGEKTYGNLINSQQLRDNAAYRKMFYDAQQANLREQMEFRKLQQAFNQWYQNQTLEEKRADRAERRAYQNAQLGLGERRLALDEYKATHPDNPIKSLSDKQVDDLSNIDESLSDMTNIINTYKNPKYKSYFGISGFAKRNPITGKFDPIVSQMSQDIELFRKTVAKAKEGGRLTDQDQKYYEKALLNPNLTQDEFLRLANRFNHQMQNKRQILLNNYAKQGKDVTNFIDYQTSGTPQTYQSGKYTVRVK